MRPFVRKIGYFFFRHVFSIPSVPSHTFVFLKEEKKETNEYLYWVVAHFNGLINSFHDLVEPCEKEC